MAVWHEAVIETLSWLFPPIFRSQGRVAVKFSGIDVRKAPFSGVFYLYQGSGTARWSWREVEAQDWLVLSPREPLLAWSMEEAKTLFAPLLPDLELGIIDEQRFIVSPYTPPTRPVLIEELVHPTHQARARIVQEPEGHFRVHYAVHAPNDTYFPVQTPSVTTDPNHEWGIARRELATRTDTREEAQQIALQELLEIVTADPTILRHEQG